MQFLAGESFCIKKGLSSKNTWPKNCIFHPPLSIQKKTTKPAGEIQYILSQDIKMHVCNVLCQSVSYKNIIIASILNTNHIW